MKTISVPRSLVDLSAGTITAVVWIDASPARVFTALTTAEVTRWWGGAPYQTTGWTATVEVGGAWRAEGRDAEGNLFAVCGVYSEVSPPRKISMSWDPDWDPEPATQLTYSLEEVNGGTTLTVSHTGFAGRTDSCSNHAAGWEMVLAWLVEYASSPRQASV